MIIINKLTISNTFNPPPTADSPHTQGNHLLHATNGAGPAPVADLLYLGSGMHNLAGSLGQFERSSTLARSSNLHQHNQFANYPSSAFLAGGSGAHKLTNYSNASNFSTYHPAPGAHLSYPYTSSVLGGHRSASGQSLLSGGTSSQLYQTSNFNAHGPLVHLPPSNQSAVLGAGTTAALSQTGNIPLHFTTSTLSAGSAIPQQAHTFASLPRTAQSKFWVTNE